MCKFRDLTADEIECRVKKFTDKGAIILLYKTARADYNVLDEVVSPDKWQCDYRVVGDNMYCTIRIWNEELKQWISKENCGIESREDGEGNEAKGEASDAFKRAGFTWGIGRKLYTSPFIFVPADKMNIKDGKTYDTFSVSDIRYDDKKITGLTIVNDKTNSIVWNNIVLPKEPGKKPEVKIPEPPKGTPITTPKEIKANMLCPVCGVMVTTKYSGKLKREIPASEQIEGAGGMCLECYNKKKAAENASKAS